VSKGKSIKILAVDDEAEITESIKRHLRFLGYEVETASSGAEALERLQEKNFHVVVTDLVMPEMNGIELLKQIRADHPMTQVIAITGYVTLGKALACLRHGAEALVLKPLDMTALEKAVLDASAKIQNWMYVLKDLLGMKDPL